MAVMVLPQVVPAKEQGARDQPLKRSTDHVADLFITCM
jgi:hypothetical protein